MHNIKWFKPNACWAELTGDESLNPRQGWCSLPKRSIKDIEICSKKLIKISNIKMGKEPNL